MKNIILLAAYMLTATFFSVAYGQTVSKEKKISGRFSADKGKLVIDNHYGKLDINTWDKNEVTVDITITAKANSGGEAQEILDRVSITEPGSKDNAIYYKTVIAKERTSMNRSEFNINYVINMPRRHTAELTNKYGDIEMEDVDGKLNIDLEYGHLKAGVIKGNDKEIKVGFGSSIIASIETGNIKSSYSKLTIEKAGNIKVWNQYEKTVIGTVRDLDIEQKYGDLKIGSADRLNGTAQYGSLTVEKLLKSVQMTIKYASGINFENVGPGVDNIDIKSSFSNLSFHFDNDASLAGNVDVSYGNVSSRSGNCSLSSSGQGMPGQGATHKVKIGSGRGNLALTLSYGNVLIK